MKTILMPLDIRATVHRLILPALLGLAAALPALGADPYAEALHFKTGQPSAALAAIQAEIRSATPEQLRGIETKLVGMVQSAEASPEAKSWACRTLRIAGSEQCVPALAALLGDPQLAADAQFALRSIQGPKVDEALRAALSRTRSLQQAGVVQTLGARGDRPAIPLVAPLASAPDPVVAEAALYALGHMGGAEALKAAQAAKVPEQLERSREHAVLLCAESLLAAGDAGEAFAVCRTLYTQTKDLVIRIGALHGLVIADPAAAGPLLSEALSTDQPRLRAAAARFLCDATRAELLNVVLDKFSSWPPDSQATVLGMITNSIALPTARSAAQSENEDVRNAALGALGRLGDTSDVPALLAAAATVGPAQAVARKSLRGLRGADVHKALVAAMEAGSIDLRCEAIRAAVPRNDTAAVPALLALATSSEPRVRQEAVKALGQLSGASDLPAMIALLARSKTGQGREAAEGALTALVQRAADKDGTASALLAGMTGASAEVRCALLRAAAQAPCARSLEALRAAVSATEATEKDTGIRCLADWPEVAAVQDLLAIARSDASPIQRALALRGVIRLSALQAQRAPEQAVRVLAEAWRAGPATEEKKAVLAALGGIRNVAALELASKALADASIEVEAANTVVRLARTLQATKPDVAAAAVQKILDACKSAAARQLAENAGIVLGGMINIAPQGTASSPDGLEKDGAASGDQAAIDGNPDTYWDEQDGGKLYRLVVTFKEPRKIAALSVLGHAHHNFAPKDFDVVCDGQPIKTIQNARYTDNFLVVPLPETICRTVELKITGYYGGSPAIRELGIYQPKPGK